MLNITKLQIIVFVGWLCIVPNVGAETLVIGRVSNEPEKTYRQLKPILDYVVSKLHVHLGCGSAWAKSQVLGGIL